MDSYSMQDVQALVGVSRSLVNAMLAAGVIAPRRGTKNEYHFTFQDLLLLRTAQSLRTSNIPTRKVVQSLKRLESLSTGRPATGMRVRAVGGAVAVQDAHGQWHVESGQRILDFEVREQKSAVVVLTTQADDEAARLSAHEIFEIAQELELDDPEEAELAYRRAIAADPELVDAYLNLGCILCDRASFDEAIDLYREALLQSPGAPLLHFNLAVALEDGGDAEAALASYHTCIGLATDFADAHYNAARLHDALGDPKNAIRHYNQYRKLELGN